MTTVRRPSPCSEDWKAMTPTERGAFCQKCQIDVVDFTNKTPTEIKQVLIKNRGKHLCGHIKKSQMDSMNRDYTIWENQSVRTFYSKFLWACILVFGMSLFTACDEQEAPENIDVGMVEYIPDSSDFDIDSDPILTGNVCVDTAHDDVSQNCSATDSIDYYDDFLIDGLMEIDEEFYDSLKE